jgi:uncharacterized membrane-anchored protein YitT (DUF2179 family)
VTPVVRTPRQTAIRLSIKIVLLVIGAIISAISVIVFQAPFDIAPAGVSGLAVIFNHLFGLPIGLVVLLGNIPIQLLAFRMLGGWKVIAASIFAVVVYSAAVEVLAPYITSTLSTDRLLNALFGGIVGGIGAALVIRGGGTMGGTSTLNRILLQRLGIPLSTSTLYTDTGVVLLAGLVFGWEGALYAIVSLYVGGAVIDYALEGPSVIRTAVIITDHADAVSAAVLALGRGVTGWEARGMYTGDPHTVLYVTVARAQVVELRETVSAIDPAAFMVIGQGHTAYGRGRGFRRMNKRRAGDDDDT